MTVTSQRSSDKPCGKCPPAPIKHHADTQVYHCQDGWFSNRGQKNDDLCKISWLLNVDKSSFKIYDVFALRTPHLGISVSAQPDCSPVLHILVQDAPTSMFFEYRFSKNNLQVVWRSSWVVHHILLPPPKS